MGLRKVNPRDDMLHLLKSAENSLSLGEISTRLGLSHRYVSYMLMEACRSGVVEKVPYHGYVAVSEPRPNTLLRQPVPIQLAELFEFVLACESKWAR